MPVEPTPRRRRLGAELRRARDAKGWTQEEAAVHLGYRSLSTVSKIEAGTQGLKLQQLAHFFEVLGITDEATREEWRELVRRAAEPDWHQRFKGVVDAPLSEHLTEIEQAESVFHWSPAVLHGLLQIPEYERAVVEANRTWRTTEDIDRFIRARREHSAAMQDRSKPFKLWSVIPEGLLRREVGGRQVAAAQVQHLINLMHTDPNYTIQALPSAAGAHSGMDGPFMLMRYPKGPDTVTIEAARALLHLNQPETVEWYRTTADYLKTDALGQKATLKLLQSIAKELAP